MSDFRSFGSPPRQQPDAETILLDPLESHHLVAVNRARAGDPVVVFDGLGHEWDCRCISSDRRKAVLQIISGRTVSARPFAVTLGQALPKGKTMDTIVRKATELGVQAVVPLETERTEVRLEGARRENKSEKWGAAAIEAAKQSGNPFLPEVAPTESLADFLARPSPDALRLIASLAPGSRTLREILAEPKWQQPGKPAQVFCLIGPEGDFSPAELSTAAKAGFAPVTLGPLVLRSETAATYLLSVVNYELDWRHQTSNPPA